MDLIASISSSIEIVKKLHSLSRKVADADFKMLLADLTNQLGDAKLEAANLKIDLATARERVEELERQASQRASTEPEVHEGAYVFGDRTRHYCTGCYDQHGRKILLNEQTGHWTTFGKWECPACKQTLGPSTL